MGRHAAQTHYSEYPQGLIFVNAIPTPPSNVSSESEDANPNITTFASRTAAFREHREAYREACWRLGKCFHKPVVAFLLMFSSKGSHLRTWEQQYNENMNTVVYVIDPFTNTSDTEVNAEKAAQGYGDAGRTGPTEDNGQFMIRALADILAAQSKSSRRSTVLQIVPASEVCFGGISVLKCG